MERQGSKIIRVVKRYGVIAFRMQSNKLHSELFIMVMPMVPIMVLYSMMIFLIMPYISIGKHWECVLPTTKKDIQESDKTFLNVLPI